MDNNLDLTHPNATEAADINTSAERLTELARDPSLFPLIAANPATPADILDQLATHQDREIRRAVVSNPNTSLKILLHLAQEFPHEFLANPVLPLLNMAQPDFIRTTTYDLWLKLLRCEEMPTLWMQWHHQGLVTFRSWSNYNPRMVVNAAIDVHVSMMDTDNEYWRSEAKQRLHIYENMIYHNKIIMYPIFAFLALSYPDLAMLLFKQAEVNDERINNLMLTYFKSIDAALLTRLSRNQLPHVVSRVARHPLTPVSVLEELARHSAVEVRRAAASNPHTPPQALQHLALDPEPTVRRAAALHPYIPLTKLHTLALDALHKVRAAVALHPTIDEEVCQLLVDDTEPEVRAQLARNVHVPSPILSQLARDPENVVRATAARNTHLPQVLFFELSTDPAPEVRAALAANSQLPIGLYWHLYGDSAPGIRRSLAANPRAPLDVLQALQLVDEMEIREGLARNPHATPEMLTWLAQHGDAHVCISVAAHKRTPIPVLRELAARPEYAIRHGLAVNPHTPLPVLTSIIDLNDTRLFFKIVHHPAFQRHRRSFLLNLFCEEVKKNDTIYSSNYPKILLEYPELPEPLLDAFAESPHWTERYLVACHTSTAYNTLNALIHDGNFFVRAAAREALAQLNNDEELE